MNTYVMSTGGKRFSFYVWINGLSHFSLSHSFCSVRGPSALDKFTFIFFFITSNDNAYICDVHSWSTFFVLFVN